MFKDLIYIPIAIIFFLFLLIGLLLLPVVLTAKLLGYEVFEEEQRDFMADALWRGYERAGNKW